MKQKPLPNANAAIECMQGFTKTDFYHELHTRTSDFPFVKSVKGESSTSSASAAVMEGKGAEAMAAEIVPVSENE